MDSLVVFVATYAIFAIALGAAVVWVRATRPDKITMVVAGAITLLLVWLAITVAGHAWTDPRPFVVDGRPPLIPHPADNGFPSDHTILGAAIAATVTAWRRWWGAGLFVLVFALGAARVAARVHHVPDVVGGLLIGVLCAALGVLAARFAVGYVERRRNRDRVTSS